MTPEQRKAMEMGLEALDIVKIHFTQNRHVKEAIIALRQCLEQCPHGVDDGACKECYEQQPSEGGDCDSPSWCKQYGKCHRKVVGAPTLANCIDDQQPAIVQRAEEAFDAAKQRGWVGLSDEDVTWLCNTAKSHDQTWGMFVRAIEAKLKEKNT